MDVSLRPERSEDEEFLLQLYSGTRATEMELTPWSQPQKDAFLKSQFRLQRTHYTRCYPGAKFDIVEAGGQPIGRLYVHRTNSEIRIMDIALIPEHRNRGLGRTLLQQLVLEAQANGRVVTLHVEADNPARRLYTRMGFREIRSNGPYVWMERSDSDAPETTAQGQSCHAGA